MAKATAVKNKPGVSVTKSGDISAQGVIIQNITIRPVQRSMVDIDKWRSYHQQAESISGSRVPLLDLYDDVTLDGFLKRLIAKRVLGVTKNKLKIINTSGVEMDGVDDVLKSRSFRKLRQRIQLHKAWEQKLLS